MTEFDDVVPALRKALQDQKYISLTPVQKAVVTSKLGGADALVSAQTGSGKTVAFGLAIASTILGLDKQFAQPEFPGALIVTPTRELAIQVKAELQWLYKLTKAQIASCVGGMDMRNERRALERGAHIIVGTPGRLRDHLERNSLDVSQLKALVLDEADEMLDLGFKDDLEFILKTSPKDRQTLLFSATLPKTIINLAKNYQKNAVRISTQNEREQHHDIEYQAITIAPNDKENAIINILRFSDAKTALVFCGTRVMVNHMTSRFANRGFSVVALSGELSQEQRTHALSSIRSGRARICIATDVAARGIDIQDLKLVIHADLPKDHESLLHRSGRTGRAGKKGTSVLVVPYQRRRFIERLLERANIDAQWIRPPSAEDILKRDRERILEDPALIDEISEDESAFAKEILSNHSPMQVATAFIRQHLGNQTAPEELLDDAPSPKSQKRDQNFKNSVWYSLSVGGNDDAEPRWLLPMLCRAAHLNKNDIGAIRVQPDKTIIELSSECVVKFNEAIGSSKKLGKTIEVAQLDKRPEISDAPRVKRPKHAKRKHSLLKSNTRSDYKNDMTERGLEEAKQKSVLEAEEPNKGFGDIKPKGNLRAKKAKSNLKTKALKDISKSELDTKKLDDDFDKFIKQLEEIDTRLPTKDFRKKNKAKKSARRTQDHKKFLSSNTSEKKTRWGTKRKPMKAQQKRKSSR
ncbi:MAG: DEAD/DEAH box helicase [Pseudomonadota bacterium]|nr:DEAD/DEAH box helicase [Pseudomonadota bacterium]